MQSFAIFRITYIFIQISSSELLIQYRKRIVIYPTFYSVMHVHGRFNNLTGLMAIYSFRRYFMHVTVQKRVLNVKMLSRLGYNRLFPKRDFNSKFLVLFKLYNRWTCEQIYLKISLKYLTIFKNAE